MTPSLHVATIQVSRTAETTGISSPYSISIVGNGVIRQPPRFDVARVSAGSRRAFAAPLGRAAQISSEKRLECRRTGADDGQVAFDGCPEPQRVADPGLIPGLIGGNPYVDCANDARGADPSWISE